MNERRRFILPEYEKSERIRHLLNAFEEGMNSPNIIGYHGTSIETIKYITEYGILPGSEVNKLSTSKEGCPEFSIYYLKSSKKDAVIFETSGKFYNDKLLKGAADYAEIIATEHYFMSQLGMNLNTNKRITFVDIEEHTKYREQFMKKHNFSKTQIDVAIKATLKAKPKGVILGISRNALREYSWTETDEGGELAEVVIKIPKGFIYKNIADIEPQGQAEYNYFTELQNRIS